MPIHHRFFQLLLWLALIGFVANKAVLPTGTMFNAIGSGDLIILCPGNFKSQMLMDSVNRYQTSNSSKVPVATKHDAHAHHHHMHHHDHASMDAMLEQGEDVHAHHRNKVDATESCVLAAFFAVNATDFSIDYLREEALRIRQKFAQYQRDVLQIAYQQPLSRAPPQIISL